jgi:isocitrate/isopropylmalate dehydrogenase
MLLSTALLFRYLDWESEAEALERAVSDSLKAGAATQDLGGTLSTSAMGTAIRERLPS